MGRTIVFLVTAVIILGPIISLTAVGSVQPTEMDLPETDDSRVATNDTLRGGVAENNTTQTATKPGAQFVGVIGAHREQHAGAVDEQRVEVRISKAETPEENAEVVATIHQQNKQRLDDLADRRTELTQAYQNRSLSESEYRARIAALDVEIRSVERVAIRLENAADELSISLLLEVGIDLKAIQDLQTRARSLQGSELATIAPSFARNRNASEAGTPGSSRNETPTGGNVIANVSEVLDEAEAEVQVAREEVDEANQTIDETLVSETVSDLLNQAQHNLSLAEQRLASARAAQESGDEQRAIELANEAIRFARTAIEQAEAAIDRVL